MATDIYIYIYTYTYTYINIYIYILIFIYIRQDLYLVHSLVTLKNTFSISFSGSLSFKRFSNSSMSSKSPFSEKCIISFFPTTKLKLYIGWRQARGVPFYMCLYILTYFCIFVVCFSICFDVFFLMLVFGLACTNATCHGPNLQFNVNFPSLLVGY